MAFQAGSTIRPELGNADYSGFARAAEIQGAALANLGAQIGQGIEKYNEKKKEADDKRASFEFLKQTGAFGNVSDDALRAGINAVGADKLVNLYGDIEETKRQQELQAPKLEAARLENLRSQQNLDFAAQNQPLQLELTEAQIAGMAGDQQRAREQFPVSMDLLRGNVDKQRQQIAQADVMNPIIKKQALANVAATKQGTEASKEGLTLAKQKQALSKEVAKNTRKQNERKIDLAERELKLKIAALDNQRDSISVKQAQSAQEFLDENDFTILDGAVYKKSGILGGTLTEVLNPAILELEGVPTLLRMSANAGAVPSAAASENFEGMRIVPEGEGGQPVVSESAVSEAALDSVVQPRPEGSRLERGAYSIMRSLGNFREAGLEFGKGTKALPVAAFDYLVNPDSPSFDVSKARARGLTTPLFQ